MTIQFNDKGKFFTEIISKSPVPAIIQTVNHRIHGNVYVREGDRLIDELQHTGQFLAVTKASVYNLQEDAVLESHFITINRDHIVWILPLEEVIDMKISKGGME